MKSIITTILVAISSVLVGQDFEEEDWKKLDQATQEMLIEKADNACNCLTTYKKETNAFLRVIFKLSKVERKGGVITPAMEEEYDSLLNDCQSYLECLKERTFSNQEKAKIARVIENHFQGVKQEDEMKKLRFQMIGYAIQNNCGEGSEGLRYAMNFVLINVHLSKADQNKTNSEKN